VCPDGLIMCCLCFERVPMERLNRPDGWPEDVCVDCAEREKAADVPLHRRDKTQPRLPGHYG
jgi:hypothetical protein